jgi:hypothetical protein
MTQVRVRPNQSTSTGGFEGRQWIASTALPLQREAAYRMNKRHE